MKPREIRAACAPGPARRTYWCLEGLRRKPSDYEITSTALLYQLRRGAEVRTPVLEHQQSQRTEALLRSARWESFEDPARFTYSAYVAERRDQEAVLDRLLERPHAPVPVPLRPLLGLLSALRFPLHGMQMMAAYVGAFAPSGRIAIAAAFQAADELRRIQRLCQWLSRSGLPPAEVDVLGRRIWQEDRDFQPLRRLVEEQLVRYDWGEALVALNGVIKPVFDRLWFEHVARIAERHDDEVLEKILGSLDEDGRWHRAWFVSFSRLSLEGDAANPGVMARWAAALQPRVTQVAQALLRASDGLFGDEGGRAQVIRDLEAGLAAHLESAGIARAATEQTSP
ncbi:MAG TPA: hypothetical protein VEQ58_19720 [Polyangiaceae bacterium]|nr:hypothetical protein [Polyangiaceae bacterium]